MKNILTVCTYLFIALILASCGNKSDSHSNDGHSDPHKQSPKVEKPVYPCPDNQISIDASATSFDNLRGEYGSVLTGKLTCNGAPVTNGRVNIQFPERSTDLNVSTDSTGTFKLQVSKLKEAPTDKVFKVTLLTADGDKKTENTKEFKAPAPVK